MVRMLRLTARLLWSTWPQLGAWFLFGTLIRYAAIEFAGFVGAYNATAGVLLLPLAVLGRLTALVAMLLVLRGGLAELRSAIPVTREARRREFFVALLAGILPFVAFYSGRGYLRQDIAAYTERMLEVASGIRFTELAAGTADPTGAPEATLMTGELGFNTFTITVIVIAYALRWLWGKFGASLPAATRIAAVYLELLWIYLAATLIADASGWVNGWVETRQGTAWLTSFKDHVTDWFAPITQVWDAVVLAIGFTVKATLEPLAWLTIIGVIYGQALAAAAPEIRGAQVQRVRERVKLLPDELRRRSADLTKGLTSRFTPLKNALTLMWRAGPLLIGGYVLLYTGVLFAEGWLEIGVTRLVGPHDLFSFWFVADTVLLLTVPLLIEPLRMALVASTYDESLRELSAQSTDTVHTDENTMASATQASPAAAAPEASSQQSTPAP